MAEAISSQLAATSLSSSPAAVQSGGDAGQSASGLVKALRRASQKGASGKVLIRSTTHYVSKSTGDPGSSGGVESAKVDNTENESYALVSWKTAEFAYRKSAGLSSELPTLARGLFTEELAEEEHRIVVRGYDKFFNVGELPWTKPAAIKEFSEPPYHLTFKENGCIIFISALSPTQVVVTSKHSLGTREDVEMSHAVKGEEWLVRHLKQKGKRKEDLAAELWQRKETAVFELCDDSFEEHVIAYTSDNSGLYLHGLNKNQARFSTRPMAEVDTFAREWGFIPTRWLEINSLEQVDKLTAEISRTGSWKGEAIEGFVVRTHMPSSPKQIADDQPAARPPYEPGQEWFYKIKFDEPYLMYRDWRELTRRLLKEKKEWETSKKAKSEPAVHVPIPSPEPARPTSPVSDENDVESTAEDPNAPKKSKKQRKKEQKAANQEKYKAQAMAARAAANTAQSTRPPRPELRFKRPKTVLYVEWAYDLLWGSEDGTIQPQPQMFEKFNQGKGIIALREAYLDYLRTPEGSKRLRELGGSRGQDTDNSDDASAEPKFDKTLIVPIGVPGSGKTSLFIALREIFQWGHTQSDDVQTKKTGPQFLVNIEKELAKHDVVIADRNNHLFKHRDEIVGVVNEVQKRGLSSESVAGGKAAKSKSEKKAIQTKDGNVADKPKTRIRLVALTWAFDSHALNDVHRICSERIIKRGDNHQTLRIEGGGGDASTSTPSKTRTKMPHEQILWNFLEELQPFGSSLGGEGDEGQADELFDRTVRLEIEYDQEKALRTAISALAPILDLTQPSEEQIRLGLEAARAYKVGIRKELKVRYGRRSGKGEGADSSAPRYYGLTVEADLEDLIPRLIHQCDDDALREDALRVFDEFRSNSRIVQHPHITLVHSNSVEAESKGEAKAKDGDGVGAKARWETYERLCAEYGSEDDDNDGEEGGKSEHPLTFTFIIDKLVWDGRVMALGVRDVRPPGTIPDFAKLQGGRGGFDQGLWRPHITVGTARDDIRPFEANEVLRRAEKRVGSDGKDDGEAKMISADAAGIHTSGRLQGMWH
ncbi:unnamed protein product [Tilletia controversa]|uniref:tRNA ligase n=1 Tax=Tilletia controversa TaxID=13291 RepID=A0A8X7MYS3_9BASI|nr:hypothetical protein CF328_g1061 [Tilletia controversa]KAE8253900.1 hypothetical protein A4X06_0g1158 [Tilletia controversa]CAD6905264.1 unnamed protein product [Tilletia controversa]CAD6911868.1 unnamed protein product [Tilletia controversa]CAD6947800.1 unnamed protein product [Tilletia controversa]